MQLYRLPETDFVCSPMPYACFGTETVLIFFRRNHYLKLMLIDAFTPAYEHTNRKQEGK